MHVCICVPECSNWSRTAGHHDPHVHGASNQSDSSCVSTKKIQAWLNGTRGQWPGSHMCVCPCEWGTRPRWLLEDWEVQDDCWRDHGSWGSTKRPSRGERMCACMDAHIHAYNHISSYIYTQKYVPEYVYVYTHTHSHLQPFIPLGRTGDRMLQQLHLYWGTRLRDP